LGFPISTRDEVLGYLIALVTNDISMAPGGQSTSRSLVIILDIRAVYYSHQNPRLSALAKLSTWKEAILPQPRLIEVDFAFEQLYQLHTLSKDHYNILTRFVTVKAYMSSFYTEDDN